ncbi:hypothetical protein [Pseudoalteromonas sp. T1lg122]|uniref:hypothetical protein n=1 Tax=Pseudoalteromonas sp. T1lg122 TaxID=2077094 RepID=UPI000CF5FEFA|nr:hypothetical protein [Pseudoalteromonas sp. T1lg122]
MIIPHLYFIHISITPTQATEEKLRIKFATAYFLVNSLNQDDACRKATYYIKKFGWEVKKVERTAFVSKDESLTDDVLSKLFEDAERDGIAWRFESYDESLAEVKMVEMSGGISIDKKAFHQKSKSISKKRTCLHFEAGDSCDQYISAHSIQRSQCLQPIARDGHVYQVDMENISKSGKVSYKLTGINKASTFFGFCKSHDNTLFEEIDNKLLIPSNKQAILYAYRAICKEISTKQKAIETLELQMRLSPENSVEYKFAEENKAGMAYGLKQLLRIKENYDKSLKSDRYEDIEWVAFCCTDKPNVSFSGLIYPDYDFQGRPLQTFSNREADLSLITFSFAPMETGWSVLFAWHKSCEHVASFYISSIAELMKQGRDLGSALFNLVVLNCENHAFSPNWWECLDTQKKELIQNIMTEQADALSSINPLYLAKEIEGVVDWSFNSIYDSRSS